MWHRQEMCSSTSSNHHFFATAFPFVFKYGVGMPDHGRKSAEIDESEVRGSGRPHDAPMVELKPWCKAMARRVESHCGRDWLLGFAMWNLCFRTTVNQAKSFHPAPKHLQELTAEDAEEGAKQILTLMTSGTYVDFQGKWQKVAGDMTKIWR